MSIINVEVAIIGTGTAALEAACEVYKKTKNFNWAFPIGFKLLKSSAKADFTMRNIIIRINLRIL